MATVWFCVAAAVLLGYVLLGGFDLGAGIVQVFVARDDRDTDRVLSSIGPVWDGNEVWLLVAGGTLLMAFPALFAAAFSGWRASWISSRKSWKESTRHCQIRISAISRCFRACLTVGR